MAQLGIDLTDHMAPRRKGARFVLGPGTPGDFGYLVLRNKIANLAQDVEFGSCWFDFVFFHPRLVAGFTESFQHFFVKSMGRLCVHFKSNNSSSFFAIFFRKHSPNLTKNLVSPDSTAF